LNKHCPLCPFQRACHAQAEQEDNLSLLNGVTARMKRQDENQGLFTVPQLSYLFTPRKRNKRSRKVPPVTHKLALQALAIRENKIYLHELPAVTRQPVEIFLDIEGVPDRHGYYLIGVLVCQGDTTTSYAFWADTAQEERHIWQQFVHLVRQYPDAPIYHYGSYEPRALTTLAKRYHTDSEPLTTRLVNVLRSIYGKVYFPVRSNRLKDVGHFLGAAWTSPEASGLQSLVWRHQWEQTQEAHYRERLVTYNREDCHALKMLTDALAKIQHSAETLSEIDFVHQPKQHVPEIGKEVHSQFEAILQCAHFSYDKKKISFHQATPDHPSQHEGKAKKKYASHIAHQKRENTRLKAIQTVQVSREKVCPACGDVPLHPRKYIAQRTIIDLVLTRNGVRKTLTRYIGSQGYCIQCRKLYSPPDIRKS
jgi:RNase_H superfamily